MAISSGLKCSHLSSNGIDDGPPEDTERTAHEPLDQLKYGRQWGCNKGE